MNLAQAEQHDHAQWQQVADKAKRNIETRLFIDGEYVDAVRGGRFVTSNPAPQMTPFSKASFKSTSLCIGPRAVLINIADGFI